MHFCPALLKRSLCHTQTLDRAELARDIPRTSLFGKEATIHVHQPLRISLVFFKKLQSEALEAKFLKSFDSSHSGLSSPVKESISTPHVSR